MKVKLKICRASIDFVQNVGDIVDLPADEAQSLIDSDSAEAVVEEQQTVERATVGRRKRPEE
jgi:hypothetical protein